MSMGREEGGWGERMGGGRGKGGEGGRGKGRGEVEPFSITIETSSSVFF